MSKPWGKTLNTGKAERRFPGNKGMALLPTRSNAMLSAGRADGASEKTDSVPE